MKKINEFLKHNPKYLRLQKPLKAARVCKAAQGYSNGRFGIISFREGVLSLSCRTSAEASNLQMDSQKIIDEINKKIGEQTVEKLKFKLI